MGIRIPDRTEKNKGGLPMMAVNRIPKGYTMYPTGAGSDVASGTFQGGPDIKLDANNKSKSFQYIEPWYAIGGRAIFEGADLADCIDAKLKAPATVGLNQAGDFNKLEVIPSSGLHIYIPAAPGTGAWDIDLAEKLNSNVNFTKAVPVKAPAKDGFFDYDHATDTLTANVSQKGGYNLYDFPVTMFQFCNRCWAKKGDGSESNLEATDVVGKILLPHWYVEFTLDTSKTQDIKVGVIMNIAVRNNV